MRFGQVFSLLLMAAGTAAIVYVPQIHSVMRSLNIPVGTLEISNNPHLPLTMRYASEIRAGGAMAMVLGLGGLIIPWVNAMIHRRPPVTFD